ncbi:uroporphyrinogen-III synthase [Parasphingorhabdus sp.]|uniref:uroporphyrinogen-III synthase n=1 Tax=Parasphingorhabdus sp. TaxID=2709688 RepID=UPI003266FC36
MSPKLNLPLLILRPEIGASRTAEKARLLGLTPVLDPLFVIEPMGWDAPAASEFDALMLTSVNAIRFAGPALAAYACLPVLAVGKKTADAARAAGFCVDLTGSGGALELLSALPPGQYRDILHLTGKDHITIAAKDRFIDCQAVYNARALFLGEAAQTALSGGCVVMVHSARAARTLEQEMARLALKPGQTRIAALSDNIANALEKQWKAVHVADEPTDDALLSLAASLCSKG